MSDARDKLSGIEENIIKKRDKYVIINKYVPDGVKFNPPQKNNYFDMTESSKLNDKNKDTTLTKKDNALKYMFLCLLVMVVLAFIWLFWTGKNKRDRHYNPGMNTKAITETKPANITEVDLEKTINQNNLNATLSQQKLPVKDDKGSSFDETNDKLKQQTSRNYNTPLQIKYDTNSFGMSTGLKAPRLPIPKSAYVRVILEQGILAGNIDMPVAALAYVDLTNNGHVLIPSGSKFIGKANYSGGNRVEVIFDYVIFPNGKEYSIKGVALGEDNVAGVPGNMDYKLAKKSSSMLASSLLGAASSSLSVTGNSFGTMLAGNMAGNTADSLDNAIDYSSRNNSMAVSVPMNLRFKIVFQ